MAQLELFHNGFLVALCTYMLLISRAMIKAGFDDRRPGAWGWIGIVMTLYRTLYILYATVAMLFPSTVTPKFMLEPAIRHHNKQLPQDMGDGLALTRIAVIDDELFYFFRVDGDLNATGRQDMQVPLLEAVEGQEVCQDLQGYFKGGISTVSYQYTFDNDTVSRSIDAGECLAWLAAQ